ncbi:MAG: hypothetical protein K6G31_10985 [Paludibacteraceae bacterium]|nr:hypothetical protein [Paludibacteraceae bacterium]MCR5569784.1 hypothetical protein [Paludibacteraceae bacterium]
MEKDEQKQQGNNTNEQPKGQPVDTPGFVKKLLEQLGCPYEASANNPSEIIATYQGEKFAIRSAPGYPFVRIHDMWWYSVDLDNLEDIVSTKKAINEVNAAMPGFTIVFNMSEQEKMMGVHTMSEILLIEPIPNTAGYLQHILNGFFQQKKNFAQCLEAIKKADNSEKGN